MNRKTAKEIRAHIMSTRTNAEKVRFRNGEIHAYGQMRNTTTRGWWFAGWVQDVEIKGLACLG